jgi:hydrogenase maturation protein HypF
MENLTYYINISGIVQGVGFRPYVYKLATNAGLKGWVCNSAKGVEIEITGTKQVIDNFIDTIKDSPPSLSSIDKIYVNQVSLKEFPSFLIRESIDDDTEFLPVSPDISICSDCKRELFDTSDRRYHYPFINCTNCGPRFSITRKIPYDRPNTSMEQFALCPDCLHEYQDPADRRFHAQPIACKICGPHIWFEENESILGENESALQLARSYIKNGKIIALKGLGGFHLVCDATNSTAVQRLRSRKHRTDKPFALMAFDEKIISEYCEFTENSSTLLNSPQAPIMLLPSTIKGKGLQENLAPGQKRLGYMLPYTPLHCLLLEPATGYPKILVMTSANISEEPIAFINEEARTRLSNLADAFLMHNRPIHIRIDDSVYTENSKSIYPVRRARGFAPNPISLHKDILPILGSGSLLKNTFCISRDHYAFVSHHIGDLENYETLQAYRDAIQHYEKLFRIRPITIAGDMHPDYLARQYAINRAKEENIPYFDIQHHHAHIAACLAENKWEGKDPVIGLCFDGTGYGTDGKIWGGEIMIVDFTGFDRRYFIAEMPLPGGDAAIQKPYRLAYAYLKASEIDLDEKLPLFLKISEQEKVVIDQQLQTHFNTQFTSSMGRLFDVVASLLGIRYEINYEAQAAIELESIADYNENGLYPFSFEGSAIQIHDLLNNIVLDVIARVASSNISAKFHNTIVQIALEACKRIRSDRGINHVALSGGVWQNIYLFDKMVVALEKDGFIPIFHHLLPPNDACLSLGQVVIAAEQMKING